MTKKTIATMFGGCGGVEIGAIQAGFVPLWTIEYDLQIALWHQLNFPKSQVIWNDVSRVDYNQLPAPYWLHVSPQCKRASVASRGKESKEDIAQARAICDALTTIMPTVFTLENVYFYRMFEAFTVIIKCLYRLGYNFDYWHLNAADYGVPQTRKRLVLMARQDGRAIKPPEITHTQSPQSSLFGASLKPWVGWYEAIEDLIPDLPESDFADWQIERLPKELKTFLINGAGNTNFSEAKSGKGCRTVGEPSHTVTMAESKAFLLGAGTHSNQLCIRGFMVDGQNSSPPITIRNSDAPSLTLTNQYKGAAKAFIVSDFDGAYRYSDNPAFTVRSIDTGGTANRVYLETGRIVRITPRALARFQSFPDDYQLPSSARLACKVIGNAVPPKLILAIAKAID